MGWIRIRIPWIRNFCLDPDPDPELGKFRAGSGSGSGSGINHSGSTTLPVMSNKTSVANPDLFDLLKMFFVQKTNVFIFFKSLQLLN